jgi:predicted nucleotidyltransferase component of viral defense system
MNQFDYELAKWKNYSRMLGFAKADQSEKDYLQELVLFELYSGKFGGALVFRGGTAISKFYGSGRFSEDIDIIIKEDIEAAEIERETDRVLKGLNAYYSTSYSTEHYRNMLKYKLKIKGPIYTVAKNEQAKQTLQIDINTRERPFFETKDIYRTTIYEDLKPYMINIESPQELLTDKLKAIIERTKPVARDLYDAWILIKKHRIKPDLKIVNEKITKYGKKENEVFSAEELNSRVREIKKIWERELSRLMRTIPDYNTVRKEFEKSIR